MSKLSTLAGSIALGLALFVPAFAMAQTSTTGLLNVYVQVINQTGYTYAPSNFTVSVSGTSPSPSSFSGSQSGTLVSIAPGTYNVTVVNANGFTPSYSVGCNSTVAAGQTQTCVITMSGPNSYNYPSTYYPAYTPPSLSCVTNTPTVALGQTARFTATSGLGGTYNWMTPNQNYPNVGPVLTVVFQSSGSQVVSVTNGPQTAYCTINVTTSYYPQPINNPGTPVYPYPATSYPNYTYPSNTYPNYTYQTQTYYPRLPNTGFAPSNGAEMAFAVVLVMGAALAVYPYARKAFTLAVR